MGMDRELAWPEPGMTLFEDGNGSDWRANACMPHSPDWLLYTMGYERAAKILIERSASGRDQDLLIYPIMFTARQAIELGFKEIIQLGNRLLDEQQSYPRNHDILGLWLTIRNQLQQLAPAEDDEAMEAFEDLIRQVHSIDPKSLTFRYPRDREDRPTFYVGGGEIPELINTRKLGYVLESIFNFLGGARDWLNDLVETQQDIARENAMGFHDVL